MDTKANMKMAESVSLKMHPFILTAIPLMSVMDLPCPCVLSIFDGEIQFLYQEI